WSLVNMTGGVVAGDLVAVTGNQSATFSGHKTGTANIHAVVSGLTSVDSNPLTVIAGAASQYLVTSSNNTPAAGSAVTITAQLADTNGNPVSTSSKVITWSSTNGGSFGSATSNTNGSGVATVSFTTSTVAGTVHTVTATDDSTPTHLTGTSGNI